MWSEINLASAVVRTGLFSLSVRLSYEEDSIGHSKGHGKTASSYTSILIPPVGVPTLQLHRVVVNLDFDGQASDALNVPSLCESVEISPFSELSSSPPRSTEIQAGTSEYPSRSASQPQEGLFVQDDDFVSIEDVDGKTQTAFLISPSLPLYRSRPSDPDLPRLPSNINQDKNQAEPPTFPGIAFHLVESILRNDLLGISRQPRSKRRKIDTNITLPGICPAMFSPGYLKVLQFHFMLIQKLR